MNLRLVNELSDVLIVKPRELIFVLNTLYGMEDHLSKREALIQKKHKRMMTTYIL